MRYQTYFHRTETRVSPGWMPEDDPIVTTDRVRVTGWQVYAPDRAEALRIGRYLYGPDFAGAQALDVDCAFCEDQPVGNMAAVWDSTEPKYAPCPRCGRAPESYPEGVNK